MRGSVLLLTLWTLLTMAACRRTSPPPSPLPSDPRAARFVLEAHCGTCHRPDQPTAMPGALAIFDLSEGDFVARMSEAQLRHALGRVQNLEGRSGDSEEADFGGPATADEVRTIEAFVDAELARRRLPRPTCASL